jgi:uncharacterized protein
VPEGHAPALAPTTPAERIESIDILRGLALFGVLVVNLVGSFRISFLEHFILPGGGRSAQDQALDSAIRVALEGKALALFAFLFGAGLAMQHERLSRSALPPEALLRRRLLVLLGFGVVHLLLLWNGDILTHYAVAGLLAMPLLAAPEERLHAWLPGLMLATILLAPLASVMTVWDLDIVRRDIARANVAYATGSFLEVRRHSLEELARYWPLTVSQLPQTLALFIAGMLAWRAGYLRDAPAHAARLRQLAAVGLGLGGALTLFNQLDPGDLGSLALLVTLVVAPLLLAMGYAAAILLLLRSESVRERLRPVAALGRMAFTNYITQSVVLGLLFFGYGLGLYGKLDTARALAIGIALYAVQLAFSQWWLARYRFGPLEWAWRSLTYARREPLRR